jgi:hypothetical protein
VIITNINKTITLFKQLSEGQYEQYAQCIDKGFQEYIIDHLDDIKEYIENKYNIPGFLYDIKW